jgi:diguanylate cyclase (GGDEF)-like protein
MSVPQQALASSEPMAWVREAIEASGDLVYDWDLAGGALAWIGLASSFFGSDATDLPESGAAYAARIHSADLPKREQALTQHLKGAAPYDCEYRLMRSRGEECWVHDRGQVKFDERGEPKRLIGTLRLIDARKQHEARLERLVSFDDLTGHFNKLRLEDALEHRLAQCRKSGESGAFLVLGIDHLAKINNAYGYEIGDKVLIAIGQRLDHLLRPTDVVGRIGTDRFGVLLPRANRAQLQQVAERMLRAVREMAVPVQASRVRVTISIGGILFPGSGDTPKDIITRGETALQQAKRDGRDCFTLYRQTQQQDLLHRRSQSIATEVEQAIAENRLCFAFQPIVRAVSHEVAMYECLVRLKSSDGELIPAAAFVPVVEQMGLIRQMDRHVLELAVAELKSSDTVSLAMNISGLTATDQVWLRTLKTLVQGRRDLARRLVLEITETAALQDIDETARFLREIRGLGCRVSLDDFGAGFTSFRHLQALTFDIVKIDGAFVRQLRDNPEQQLFVRNLVGLADAFGLETVAECVETGEDAAFLANEGVQFLQGYYFGRPTLERRWREQDESAARPSFPPAASAAR